MPRTVARLLLSVGALVGAATFYILAFVVIEDTLVRRDATALAMTSLLTCGLFGPVWLLIWFGEVSWTPARMVLTVGSAFWSLGPALAAFGVLVMLAGEDEVGILLAAMAWAVSWITSTALVWRETKRERLTRLQRLGVGAVACPTCGYNLTGLREAKCPECGSQYTLDQLFAGLQADRELVGGHRSGNASATP